MSWFTFWTEPETAIKLEYSPLEALLSPDGYALWTQLLLGVQGEA